MVNDRFGFHSVDSVFFKMKWYDIVIWILFITSIVVALWYLLGNSPTFEQAILVFILTILFTIGAKISDMRAELNSLKYKFGRIEDSFIKLVNDFKSMKKRQNDAFI